MQVDLPESGAAPNIVIVQPHQTVHWVLAALLAIIALGLVFRDGGILGGAPLMAQDRMMGARGLFAFTGQLDKNRYGLWMMDVDAGTVWCYEYNTVNKRMRLVAARSFIYDRYLKTYNQDSPTREEVQVLLSKQRIREDREARLGPPDDAPNGENAAAGKDQTGVNGS